MTAIAVMAAMPIFGVRLIGREGIAVLSLPLAAAIICILLSDLMWERPTFRGVRRLLSADQQNEARKYSRAMSLFGVGAAILLILFLMLLRPVIYGDSYELVGSVVTLVAGLPALMLLCASGGRRGYLRARGGKAELMIASFFQNVLLFILPFLIGRILAGYGEKVDALLRTNSYSAVYGAIGAMIGMDVACLVSFIILLVGSIKYHTTSFLTVRARGRGGYAFLSLDGLIPAGFLGIFLFDTWRYFHTAAAETAESAEETGSIIEQTAEQVTELAPQGGLLADWGGYMGVVFLPTLCLAVVLALPFLKAVFRIHARYQRDDRYAAQDRMAGMIRRLMILIFPISFMASGLAGAIVSLICAKPDDMLKGVFRLQAAGVPLLTALIVLSILFNKLGGKLAILVAGAIGAIVHIVVVLLISRGGHGLYPYVIAHLAGIAVMLVVTSVLMSVSLSYRQEWMHGVAIPFLCAILAALPSFALGGVFVGVIGEALTIILLSVVGLFLYMILLTLLHGITEYELYRIPGGKLFAGLSRVTGRNRWE